MLITASRFLAIPIGLLAYYVAFFMYEDEEGRWQNRIENFWIAVNDYAQSSGGKTSSLFNSVAGMVTRVFNRILGRKLLSLQFVGVSSSYSLAAMCLFTGSFLAVAAVYIVTHASAMSEKLTKDAPLLLLVGVFVLLIAFICLVLAAMPSLWPSRFSVALSLLPGLLVTYAVSRIIWFHHFDPTTFGVCAALTLGLLSDVLLLILVRFTIRRVSAKPNFSRIAVAVLLQIAGVALFVVIPVEAALHVQARVGIHQRSALGFFSLLLATFNLFTGLASFLFGLVLVGVLLHKALWPTVSRLIYPLARFEIVRSHKLVAGIGTGCFIFAFPLMWAPVKSVLVWLAK